MAMISGLQALQSIEEAYAKVRGDEMQLDAALRSASEEAARLRQERLAQLHALAQLKFGLIQRGELISELDAAERQATELLDRIRREIDEAAKRRQEAADALQKAEAAGSESAESYDAAVSKLRAFEDGMAPTIMADPNWAALNGRVQSIQQVLEEADKKAGQAEADRQRKKTPYEQDPLFMYLWKRKFGTAEYPSGFFVRYFDELIAKLIRYQDVRANYSLLNQIPERLREHAERVRAEFEAERQRLIALRQDQLLKAGARPLQEKAAQALVALEASEAELSKANQRFEALDREYDALNGADNRGAFAQAIDLMAENDSRDDIVTLYKEAARTKTDEDRRIVEKIDQLTKSIAKADGEISKLRGRIQEVAARRTEIQQARNEFRQRRYEYPGTSFGNEATINDVLGGILDGMVRGAVLGQVLQQGYRRPTSPGWDGRIDMEPIFPPSRPRPPMGRPSGGEFDTGGTF
jgi:hypothetical protein